MLKREFVFFNEDLGTKEEVFDFISNIAFESGVVSSKESYYGGLIEREKEGTTGVGENVAIPHAKLDEINKAAVFVIHLKQQIEWESLDDEPVKVVIALAIPKAEGGTTHIKILTQIATNLMEDDFRIALLTAKNSDEIYNLVVNSVKL